MKNVTIHRPAYRTIYNLSFRDRCAHRSWESVIPLHKAKGVRIATTSDIGHWFRNDTLQEMLRLSDGGLGAARPTEHIRARGDGRCGLPRPVCELASQ